MAKLSRQLKYALKQVEYMVKGKKVPKYAFYEIKYTLLNIVLYSWWTPITVFWESCVRTAKWFPIIWKDRHWDHWFILEILKHKIRFQRECIGKYGHHVRAQEDCKNMRIAEILINRLQESDYCKQDWEEHYKRWPCRFFKFDEWDAVEHDPEEGKDSRRILDREVYMKSQDYDYLFKHLKKHLERWWD